ncbi:hypothetical protein Ciccas_014035, partial [Cichlidogyrus casuarinus]
IDCGIATKRSDTTKIALVSGHENVALHSPVQAPTVSDEEVVTSLGISSVPK